MARRLTLFFKQKVFRVLFLKQYLNTIQASNHPRIIVIKNARIGSGIYFCEIIFNGIYKEVKRLKVSKAAQSTDILVKIKIENDESMRL